MQKILPLNLSFRMALLRSGPYFALEKHTSAYFTPLHITQHYSYLLHTTCIAYNFCQRVYVVNALQVCTVDDDYVLSLRLQILVNGWGLPSLKPDVFLGRVL